MPNITFGATMVKWLRQKLPGVFFGEKQLLMCSKHCQYLGHFISDLHMMVSEPEKVGREGGFLVVTVTIQNFQQYFVHFHGTVCFSPHIYTVGRRYG